MINERCRLPVLLLLGGAVLLCVAHQIVIPLVAGQRQPEPGQSWILVTALPKQEPGSAGATEPAAGDVDETAVSPSSETPGATHMPETPPIVLTVVYDNRTQDPLLRAAWGFACLIETPAATILFDTGGDGAILMHNMATLGIDPGLIDIVVLSHHHSDHTGGLPAVLESNDHLVVYVPASFASGITASVQERAQVVAVTEPLEIVPGVWTLGEMGSSVREQSLALEESRGLAVVTGCAHPGIVAIVERARDYGRVDLVLGGFHLGDRTAAQIEAVVEALQGLGVQRVGPGHCTGELAIEMFHAAFGAEFVSVHVGTRVTLEP